MKIITFCNIGYVQIITIIVPLIVTLQIYLQRWHFSETTTTAVPFDSTDSGRRPTDSSGESLLDWQRSGAFPATKLSPNRSPLALLNSPSSGAIAGTSGAAEWFAYSVAGSTLTGSWVCNRHRWWQTWAVESSCWSLTRSSANSIAQPCNHHFAKNTATTKRQTSFIQRTTSGVNYFFYQKQFFVIYKSFPRFLSATRWFLFKLKI
jgi:hypothetical protein